MWTSQFCRRFAAHSFRYLHANSNQKRRRFGKVVAKIKSAILYFGLQFKLLDQVARIWLFDEQEALLLQRNRATRYVTWNIMAVFLTDLLTRSSANPEQPCEHTVSWNRVKCCTNVRRIACENVCNRWMTFKVIQGHCRCHHLIGHILFPISLPL